LIITVDGPAGSGKSTIARLLAGRIGGVYLDTGAMYRSVTLVALESGADIRDEEATAGIARNIRIEFGEGRAGQKTIVNGRDRTADIRSRKVDTAVSIVSAHRKVRERMVDIQRGIARTAGKVVAEGRDTGSVVFPRADLKIYLDADPSIRARRRAEQRGETPAPNDVAEIVRRDRMDSSRKESPLVIPEGALIIDTTNLKIDGILEKILELLP